MKSEKSKKKFDLLEVLKFKKIKKTFEVRKLKLKKYWFGSQKFSFPGKALDFKALKKKSSRDQKSFKTFKSFKILKSFKLSRKALKL